MERGEFNDLMKDAFKDAEVTPSENVWTNIELELEKEEGGSIRRRLFYYKMVAAASVIFALSVGAASIFVLNTPSNKADQQALLKESQNTIISENQNPGKELDKQNRVVLQQDNLGKDKDEEQSTAGIANTEIVNQKPESNSKAAVKNLTVTTKTTNLTTPENSSVGKFYSGLVTPVAKENSELTNDKHIRMIGDKGILAESNGIQTSTVSQLSRKLKPTIIKVGEAEVVPDAGALLLAKLAQQEQAMQAEDKKKEKPSERLWTSVGFAAGGFNAVNSSVTPAMISAPTASTFSQNISVANQQAKASGSTYSVGFNIGTRVSKRWVLQGGFNYLTQASNYTANTVITSADFQSFKVASYALTNDASSSRVVSTASYEVNNSLQYVSMPIQAGYVVVNKKVVVQLNSGVSTDLFLQNTLTSQDGGLDKTTQQSGSESPYRTVNFSGLVGTEISYKFGQHYRLALNPGLRYPFNSIYKSDVGISASPLTFDVGLRFRYIFH